jgi:hypothetical protein
MYLAPYRNPSLPAAYRNLVLILPILAVGFVPVLVLLAPSSLNLDLGFAISRRVRGLMLFGAIAMMLGGVGLSLTLMFSPPRWLIPGWLREEDMRVGFVPPGPGRFDWAMLALGAVVVVVAGGCLAFAVYQLLAPA